MRDAFHKLAVPLVPLLYVLIAAWRIDLPGVHYDEIFFANAALRVDHTFIRASFHGLPLLVMPYVGALKAYLMYPVFSLLGVSPATVRLPMIALAGLSLYWLYRTLVHYFDEGTAWLALLLAALDPFFLVETRHDFGPVVIEYLTKVGALWSLAWFLKKRTAGPLALCALFLAAGLFNKLSFVWFVTGFVLGALLFYWRELRAPSLQASGRAAPWIGPLVLSGTYAVLMSYYFAVSRHYQLQGLITFRELPSRLAYVWRIFRGAVTGEYFCRIFFEDLDGAPGSILFVTVMAVMLFGSLVMALSRELPVTRHRRAYFFVGFVYLAVFAQIIATRRATAGWHVFALYPMQTILFASGLVALYEWIGRVVGSVFVQRAAGMLAIALLVAYDLALNVRYIHAYARPLKNINWSPKIYELIEYTKDDPHKFVSVDWGIHNQLIDFTQIKNKYYERVWELLSIPRTRYAAWAQVYLEPSHGYLFIAHPQHQASFAQAREVLFEIARDNGYRLELIKTISDERQPIFEIYAPRRG